jgi:transcriptional regulator with XRE-family HTH domain
MHSCTAGVLIVPNYTRSIFMKLFTSWKQLAIGGAAALAVTAGLTAVSMPEAVNAQGARANGVATQIAHRSFGERGDGIDKAALLAEALGISVDELTAAHEAVRDALLDEAVATGDLTQEQVDNIRNGEWFGHRGFAGRGFGHHGDRAEHRALLADELGISVEALEAAHDAAREAGLAQAIADGTITQEQADLMAARRAVAEYLDHEAVLAQVLGMPVEELAAAREEGASLRDLIAESGLSRDELKAALQSAHAAAVEQAVADGVITTEQAEQLHSDDGRGFGHPHGRGRRGHGDSLRDGSGTNPDGASFGPRRGAVDGSL